MAKATSKRPTRDEFELEELGNIFHTPNTITPHDFIEGRLPI
jgi:hypothetical protein